VSPTVAGKGASQSQQSPRRGKVLLVDDELRDCQYYSASLLSEGYEVYVSASYSEGLRWLDVEHFDFVLVNQGSRLFEGRTVLKHAKEINRHLPVLVLAHCLDMSCYMEAMQLGALDYFEKPIPPTEIVRLVRTSIQPQQGTA
jgi:DNA-binding NtrC family response regulator